MIQIPQKGILLVPAHWHLPLYREILNQKQNTMGMEVYSLLSYVKRFIKEEDPDEMGLLYEAKELLSDIPEDNDFYYSCQDAVFLQSCLDFIRWTKTYNIDSFPATTEKEKELRPILDRLNTMSLPQDTYSSIELPSQENVYLLEKVFSAQEMFWVEKLLDKGAKYLSFEPQETKEYIAVSNAKKQAQYIAQTIVEKNWDAQSVSLHLCDTKDLPVTKQMLDAYKIPYTVLQETGISSISNQWLACLRWAQKPTKDHFISLLETCFSDGGDVIAYLEECPDAFPQWKARMDKPYQDNELLNEEDYHRLQELEQRALEWIHTHDIQWTYTDFAAMAQCIQEQNPHPSREDLALFQTIQTLIAQSVPYIKDDSDLDLLIHEVEETSQRQRAASIQGVLIGTMNDCCGLRDHVILVGAHSQIFPGYQTQNGIFNEEIVKHLPLPDLQTRLSQQKDQRFHTLEQAKHLMVLFPEANYDRKNNQSSIELNTWMGSQPTYQDVLETDAPIYPSFTLSVQQAEETFFPNKVFTGSVSALETYAKCPCRYFLRYGLRIKEEPTWLDVAQRGTLLHKILEKAANDHQKKYATISKEQLRAYIGEEFSFVESLFPHRALDFTLQKKDLESTLSIIFEKLAYFEENWHMNIQQEEYKYTLDVPINGITLHLRGFIDRVDTSDTSFVVFDYKSSDKKFEKNKFYSGQMLQLATYAIAYQAESGLVPVGSFYISLNPSVAEQTNPDKPKEIEELKESWARKFIEASPYTGIRYQDISIYHDGGSSKTGFSFENMKEQWEEILSSLLEDIHQGNVQPDHAENICNFCQYETICRNSRKEVKKESRCTEVKE